jgi:hypothetical protein
MAAASCGGIFGKKKSGHVLFLQRGGLKIPSIVQQGSTYLKAKEISP